MKPITAGLNPTHDLARQACRQVAQPWPAGSRVTIATARSRVTGRRRLGCRVQVPRCWSVAGSPVRGFGFGHGTATWRAGRLTTGSRSSDWSLVFAEGLHRRNDCELNDGTARRLTAQTARDVEALFRRRDNEDRIREAIGAGLRHLSSADTAINAVWLWAALLAGNLSVVAASPHRIDEGRHRLGTSRRAGGVTTRRQVVNAIRDERV